MTVTSGTKPTTIPAIDRGSAAEMMPAPLRPAEAQTSAAAPPNGGEPAMMTTPPTPHLWAPRWRRGRCETAHASVIVSGDPSADCLPPLLRAKLTSLGFDVVAAERVLQCNHECHRQSPRV